MSEHSNSQVDEGTNAANENRDATTSTMLVRALSEYLG